MVEQAWMDSDGRRPVAVDFVVDVEWKLGYTPPAPGPVRADHVAWAHVQRWRPTVAVGMPYTNSKRSAMLSGRCTSSTVDGLCLSCTISGACAQVVPADGWIDRVAGQPIPIPDGFIEIQTRHGDVDTGVASTFNWGEIANDTIVRFRAVNRPAPPAYATEAVAEHDRLTRIIEAKDVALRAAEVRVSELEHERDRAIVQLATTEALLDAANNSTRACLADYANLKCENAKLREIGEFLQDRSTELAMLHHNFNVAALRGHIALDFDEQLVTWAAPQ